MIRKGDLTGVTGLHMTTLRQGMGALALDEHIPDDGSDASDDTEGDDDEGGMMFPLPGLPGVTLPDLPPGALPTGAPVSDDSKGSDDSDDSGGEDDFVLAGASKEERKAHKTAVKEANRLKRQAKVPKHIKKRKEKLRKQDR